MGRVKEQLLIEDDLFDIEDILNCYLAEVHLVNGEKYYIQPKDIEEINYMSIKYTEPAQLHKDNEIKQYKTLISIPVSKIAVLMIFKEIS